MADDDDIPVLNEQENEYNRVLEENGYDPAEYTLAQKQQLVDDIEGSTTTSERHEMPDAGSDQLSGSIPPDERS